jgi:hypothetical protein
VILPVNLRVFVVPKFLPRTCFRPDIFNVIDPFCSSTARLTRLILFQPCLANLLAQESAQKVVFRQYRWVTYFPAIRNNRNWGAAFGNIEKRWAG